MKTKRIVLPIQLTTALKRRPWPLATLERMRPSCHVEYADLVETARTPEIRQRRIARILREVAAWGKRHVIKPAIQR